MYTRLIVIYLMAKEGRGFAAASKRVRQLVSRTQYHIICSAVHVKLYITHYLVRHTEILARVFLHTSFLHLFLTLVQTLSHYCDE